MSVLLVGVVTGIYATVGVLEGWAGHYPMAVVWIGYAVANCGMMGLMVLK